MKSTTFLSGYEIRYTLRLIAQRKEPSIVSIEEKRESKREKLRGFENRPQWSDLTQAMLEKKEVWDVVDGTRPERTTAPQTRKRDE